MVVFRSWMDTFAFAEKCKEAEEYLENKGLLAFWSSRRSCLFSYLRLIYLGDVVISKVLSKANISLSYIHGRGIF